MFYTDFGLVRQLYPSGINSRPIMDFSVMETGDLTRHKIIESLTIPKTEKFAEAEVALWEPLAAGIIAIVGVGGFDSLYTRSVFLARSTFPWLEAGAQPPQADRRFAGLKTSFEKQTPAQARAANTLLMITFTDILASLVGEQLSANILRSIWSSVPLGDANKEQEK